MYLVAYFALSWLAGVVVVCLICKNVFIQTLTYVIVPSWISDSLLSFGFIHLCHLSYCLSSDI